MIDVIEYLEAKGVQIIRDDGQELACYCPFHNNLDTPAFYVNKKTGLWICFNPSCGKTGSLRDLMEFFGDKGSLVREYTLDDIEKNLAYKPEQQEDDSWDETLEKIRVNLPEESEKLQYLIDRGFTVDTLSHFDIAYSEAKKRIVIPARNERHRVVGFIGRTTKANVEPKYLNSKGLPRKEILFNLNNAKRFDTVIIVEGCLDAMKIYQSGFPNVVASFGATITEGHMALLAKYFDTIIIFSDNDHAGFAMRSEIINKLYDKDIRIVKYESPELHDPGEMTEDQIREHITGSVDYFTWSFENVFPTDSPD